MTLASSLNTAFTMGHVARKGRDVGPSVVTAPVQRVDMIKAASLEFQHGLHRAFHCLSGKLMHSHECRLEVVRRTERDGYEFIRAQPPLRTLFIPAVESFLPFDETLEVVR